MIKFERTTDGEMVVIEIHDYASIEEAIDAFERFLLACSYKIPDGLRMGLVDED